MSDPIPTGRPGEVEGSELETTQQESSGGVQPPGADETVKEFRLAESGLHIRCPHCQHHVEFLEEHESSDVTCGTCGSIFSLLHTECTTGAGVAPPTVGHFELITRVGIGSFGAVWKAYDPELDRTVAIKIPRRGQLGPVDETQFLREARVAAQLRHPNIVSVHEIGRQDDTLYIVSDFITGVPLSDRLKTERMTVEEMLPLCQKVLSALDHAHQRGVVHRDLKPANIMMDESGEPHLTDFGLAKRDVGELTMTADGQILGTPAYMSPEQASGDAHHVDRRTDVYSMGVLLFELLTGELPFRGSAQMHIQQKLHDDPPNPRQLDRLVPRDLATICLKCIQREPGRRYGTAAALADDLQRYAAGEPIRARPISRIERSFRWARRHPALAAVAILMTVLALGGTTAAVVIDALRRDLAEETQQKDRALEDRDQQIEEKETRIQANLQQIRDLRNKLGAWEGGADPSVFWPPYDIAPPQQEVLRTALSGPADYQRNLEKAETDEQRAMVHIAIAAACQAHNDPQGAGEHLAAARDLLHQLVESAPNETRYVHALADCCLSLATTMYAEDTRRADEYLREASTIYRRLIVEDDRLDVQAAALDAELRLAVAEGSRDASALLEIEQRLKDGRTTNPQELYNLACYLTGRPPLLTSAGEE